MSNMSNLILKEMPKIDQGQKELNGKVITQKGTPIYWKLYYEKGGYNPFNYQMVPRCFAVELNRQLGEQKAFSDLTDDAGSVCVKLNEVGRFSKKQEKIALQKLADELEEGLAKNWPSL